MAHTGYFLFIEQPATINRCMHCGELVKQSTTHTGQDVMIEVPYLVTTILRQDGHFYEAIRERFQHRCQLLIASHNTAPIIEFSEVVAI